MIGAGERALFSREGDPRTVLSAEAVVFDCDGLLVDSESVWMELIAAWLPRDEASRPVRLEGFRGLGVDDAARRLADLLGRPWTSAGIQEELVERYSALLADGVRPMPGAVELVRSLSGRMPLAVASNGLRTDVLAMLDDVGILEMVDVVRTLDDVSAGKPAPDLYLAAAAALGVSPDRAVAFEDSPAGAHAAGAAGMTVIGVNADHAVELDCTLRMRRLSELARDHQRNPQVAPAASRLKTDPL
ncbi:HAD family phosphatase [Nesterenkonia sp. HG001]|uniref:HAD family hydrolase n=1 Tax=Nesterenkonia sp. HG001 TaxID=2983207 RepID=UPI002AC68E00|nr:HAD family phosphatase [Nesterenkonia sp. HG001]MDZ5078694.1 HAD family phosphatase [Nesterenkonia sp. HG001]